MLTIAFLGNKSRISDRDFALLLSLYILLDAIVIVMCLRLLIHWVQTSQLPIFWAVLLALSLFVPGFGLVIGLAILVVSKFLPVRKL